MTEPAAWARAFLLTIAVEAPIVVLWFRAREPAAVRRLAGAIYASLVTHPIVWFVFPAVRRTVGVGHVPSVAASEVFAWAIEGLFYTLLFRAPARQAFVVSAVANGASLAVGLALRALGGWV